MPPPLDTIRGEVAEHRLLKGDWGRIKLRAGSGDAATVIVTGQILGIDVGSTVECKGRWNDDPKWGRQLRATTIVTVVPNDASGAIAFIASKLPRIGRKRATELVERYGIPALWDVLEREPERIAADVKGVTLEAAREIAAAYQAVRGEREEMVTLRGWGLTESQIKRCKEVWKGKVVDELRRDPFQLCELVYGFGFKRADEVAQRMGIPADHAGRIQAALLHVLGEAEGQGHCYVQSGKLVGFAADMLGLAERDVWPQLEAVCDEKCAVRTDEGKRVYKADTYAAELEIVEGVGALLSREALEHGDQNDEGPEDADLAPGERRAVGGASADVAVERAPYGGDDDFGATLEAARLDAGAAAQTEPEPPEPVNLTRDQRVAIEEALALLAGQCDGARSEDQRGFNGRDSDFGKSLAAAIAASPKAAGLRLSAGQTRSALKMLRTYRRTQLAALADRIWPPVPDASVRDANASLPLATSAELAPPVDDAPMPDDADAPPVPRTRKGASHAA